MLKTYLTGKHLKELIAQYVMMILKKCLVPGCIEKHLIVETL